MKRIRNGENHCKMVIVILEVMAVVMTRLGITKAGKPSGETSGDRPLRQLGLLKLLSQPASVMTSRTKLKSKGRQEANDYSPSKNRWR